MDGTDPDRRQFQVRKYWIFKIVRLHFARELTNLFVTASFLFNGSGTLIFNISFSFIGLKDAKSAALYMWTTDYINLDTASKLLKMYEVYFSLFLSFSPLNKIFVITTSEPPFVGQNGYITPLFEFLLILVPKYFVIDASLVSAILSIFSTFCFAKITNLANKRLD